MVARVHEVAIGGQGGCRNAPTPAGAGVNRSGRAKQLDDDDDDDNHDDDDNDESLLCTMLFAWWTPVISSSPAD